jgi:hypothetical protein
VGKRAESKVIPNGGDGAKVIDGIFVARGQLSMCIRRIDEL